MANSYVGEITLFAGNYAPKGWAFCNGQLLSIQENLVLFAVIETTYGGNGSTNFALPKLNEDKAIRERKAQYIIALEGRFPYKN